ncbi:unnamed protein product [Knipowitschia caucasica]|uniref:Armadillo repeat-containing domain-containing protein n=1 Tax=Knipowitschia caucasica TaxID=637954 RepID=A0AAV2KVC1_KNICA
MSSGSFRRSRKSICSDGSNAAVSLQPGGLLAKVTALNVTPKTVEVASAGNLEPKHLKMLLSCLQTSINPDEKCRILITLGNASAFTVNQNLIREYDGLSIIAGFLFDPSTNVRVQTLNTLNNLSMNIPNQERLTLYVPKVLELIETSPVNSELQLCALRLLTNLSVCDKNQHLLKESLKLLLTLFVVSNEPAQVQTLKVLVNLSSNPDMMDDIVQVQAPASLLLLFDPRTSPAVLVRLLIFAGNLKAWRPSALVADDLRHKQDCLYRLMLDECSQLHSRVLPLLSHPDEEVRLQATRVFT